jgi:CDP-glucose 4,6-dehydratase
VKHNFWKNKNILITGHTGFSGGWLSQILILHGARVSGISLKSKSKNYIFELFKLKKKMRSYIFDINNSSKLKKTICAIKPEIIFHLAAQPLVNQGYKFPYQTLNTNILGTVKILEVIKKTNFTKSLVVVTSDKCYENKENKLFFKEHFNLGGDDPYSASKACQEIVTHAYYNSLLNKKKIGISTARAGNIIGGADWSKGRLMVDIADAIKKNKKISIRNLEAIRPWQFILDVLHGYMQLAKKMYRDPLKYSGTWNFGPPKNKKEFAKVSDVINIVDKILKKKLYIKVISPPFKEKINLFLDSTKSNRVLKWKKKINLKNSIKLTINWYTFFYNNKTNDIINFTNKQIKKYFKI